MSQIRAFEWGLWLCQCLQRWFLCPSGTDCEFQVSRFRLNQNAMRAGYRPLTSVEDDWGKRFGYGCET